jgi:predicted extracellular nuclease
LTPSFGQQSQPVSITINGDKLVEPNETFFVNLSHASPGTTITDPQGVGTITNDDTPNLVISQIYPGGGNASASFTNDFIELFNRGTTTVDFSVTPYSVQFLSTGATIWVKTDLTTGTIAPGQYFLIQEASGGAVGAALPAPDATGTINLTSTTPGKVALVLGASLFTGNCPGDDGLSPFNPVNSTIADFVGYGGNATTANHCYEGAGPAPFSTSTNQNARSTIRTSSCTDTNVNSADFTNPTNPTGATPPVPRNKVTTPTPCP